MNVMQLMAAEADNERIKIFFFTTFAGLSSAYALHVINNIARASEPATPETFLQFALSVTLSLLATRYVAYQVNAHIESALHKLKMRIIEKIARVNFERFERIGTTRIVDHVSEKMNSVAEMANRVGTFLQSLCVLVFGIAYIATLSPIAAILFVPVQLLAIKLYAILSNMFSNTLRAQSTERLEFRTALVDLLKGAKEIRLHRARQQEVLDDFERTAIEVGTANVTTNYIFNDNALFVTANLYALLAVVVFVLPGQTDTNTALAAKLVTAVLFVWESVSYASRWHVAYVESNDALNQISKLEEELDQFQTKQALSGASMDPWNNTPAAIVFKDVEYVYGSSNGDVPFAIGPIDLTIEPGEVLFIVGGNGCGKSTLLKVLTALYAPTRGTLRYGDIDVSPAYAATYRERFCAIFSDAHIFTKAYGLLDADPKTVHALLREMRIENKTSFKDGEFTARDLSTGQKKRLAMVIALLEDRPIFVLDEWAADQDPEFRKHFYEEMIPALKRKGKTIIAVSHDDRYFHCADRVVVMEYGHIRTIQKNRHVGSNVNVSSPTDAIRSIEVMG